MTSAESEIPFHGTVHNPSATPAGEVGGLAVFEGVLMRSRTGFAIAIRKGDGNILLTQIPFASLVSRTRAFGVPVLRGTAALGEMMLIGTRALRYSSSLLDRDESEKAEEGNLGRVILLSLLLMAGLLVLLPNVLASLSIQLFTPGLVEADHPFVYNVISGMWRLIVILCYVAGISLSGEIRRVFEYHGAEHKAVLAMEDGRDLTVDRARRHDTLHPRCGTTLLAIMALASIPLFATMDAAMLLYLSGYPEWPAVFRKLAQVCGHLVAVPVVIGAAFELVKFSARRPKKWYARAILFPGLMLQRLTTRQPNDHQIEVAIAALLGALAIPPHQRDVRSWTIRGLEYDSTAPGYSPTSPARARAPHADSGTGSAAG